MNVLMPFPTEASRTYRLRLTVWVAALAAALFGLRHWHQSNAATTVAGEHLWLIALLPMVPTLGAVWTVVRFLREEGDELQRDIEVKSMLSGFAAMVCVIVFFAVLQSIGWRGTLSPLNLLIPCACVSLTVRGVLRFRNRLPDNE